MELHNIGIKLYTFVKIGAENIVCICLDAENGANPWHIPADCVIVSDARRNNFTENGKKTSLKLHTEYFLLIYPVDNELNLIDFLITTMMKRTLSTSSDDTSNKSLLGGTHDP